MVASKRGLVATGLTVVGFALAIGACAGAPVRSSGPSATTPPSLHPGDAVRVAVWREPDLTGEFTVDEQGVVVFPLLGERTVTGVSPDSLRERLAAEYREYLRNPSVDVTVLRRINILGEVRRPGVFQVDETVTLSEALALAGGVAPTGNANDIRLIRDGEIVRQDLDRATTVGSSPIRSGDQIVVGQKSWISRNIPIVSSAIAAAAVLTAALIR